MLTFTDKLIIDEYSEIDYYFNKRKKSQFFKVKLREKKCNIWTQSDHSIIHL